MNKGEEVMLLNSVEVVAKLIELLLLIRVHPELMDDMPSTPDGILRSVALKLCLERLAEERARTEAEELIRKVKCSNI